MSWTTLCDLTDLHEGRGKYVEIDGYRLAVFLDQGQPHAIDNECPHAGGDLADGDVQAGCAVCPLHDWAFNLQTGQMPNAPSISITTYPTRLHRFENRTLVQADLPMP